MIQSKWAFGAVLVSSGLVAATVASGQTRSRVYGDQMTKQSQTLYFQGDVQATTYESEAAGSKDSNETTSLTVGAWTGEGRILGFEMKSTDADTKFNLNGSSVRTSFKDVRMMTRLGWIQPSIGATLSEIDVKSSEANTVGVYSTGLNAGVKVAVPVTLELVTYAEAAISHPTKTYDKLDQGTKLGDRSDADIGASYDLTETAVDLLVGYRVRNFKIDTDSASFNESTSGAYAGLRLGLYF